MRRIPTRLDGLVHLAPDVHADDRGFFVETFRADSMAELGIASSFVQDNHARSSKGTLRGLHFQIAPGQGKLVRVARGRIADVAVDIRQSSPTFGQHETLLLDDEEHHQLFVPVGFAHGYVVLSDVADVSYKVTAYYDPLMEQGMAWNDPDLGIAWPVSDPLLSLRDGNQPRLAEIRGKLPDW